MTGHTYRDVILEQHVRLYRDIMGAEFLLMDDNVRPHRANIVDEFLQSEDITHMDWSAYSPDLNPIEHVWDMLGRRIAARHHPLTCLPELDALLDEWCNIPEDQIDNLILSMPRRFLLVKAIGYMGVYVHFHTTFPMPTHTKTVPFRNIRRKILLSLTSLMDVKVFKLKWTDKVRGFAFSRNGHLFPVTSRQLILRASGYTVIQDGG
ncbi:transposable element Tcb1 transposase [Trichonephila clavipes]|nr:transposable element Tcb1 transposase [Trichonephila clavipes]